MILPLEELEDAFASVASSTVGVEASATFLVQENKRATVNTDKKPMIIDLNFEICITCCMIRKFG